MRCHSVVLWYGEPNAIGNAIGYAKHYNRSHDAVIHFYARIPDLQKEYTATGGKWANVRMELEQFLI
jgi:hypothetical protein